MNYNILSYGVFIGIMIFIIGYVGRMFHRNGRVFILNLFHGEEHKTDNLNNLLLLAYYLFNIGYTFVTLRFWETITGIQAMIAALADHLAVLILILAVTHYFNMLLVYLLSKRKTHFLNQ